MKLTLLYLLVYYLNKEIAEIFIFLIVKVINHAHNQFVLHSSDWIFFDYWFLLLSGVAMGHIYNYSL